MSIHLTIKARLAAVAALALVAVALLGGLFYAANRVNERALSQLFKQNTQLLVPLLRIDATLGDVRFRTAGVLLDQLPIQGSFNHLQEARKELDTLWKDVAPLAEQTFAQGEGAAQWKVLQERWPVVHTTLESLNKGYASKDQAALSAVLEDDWALLIKGVSKPLQALIPIAQQEANATYEVALASSQRMLLLGLVGGGLCLAILALVAWLSTRSILRPLAQVQQALHRIAHGDLAASLPAPRADELGGMVQALGAMQEALRVLVGEVQQAAGGIATASAQIATGNQDLSARTEQTAGSLQQTAGTMDQLTSTVQHGAESARSASGFAGTAADVAGRGGAVVQQVVQTMDAISESSRRIGDITGVIDSIAFQTNILALNAAVEAARAGEQGRGFAVVATEVRALAQRSAEAAREIKGLIQTSVQRVEGGARLVAQAGETMGEIVERVRQVSTVVAEITQAADAQAQRIGAVGQSVNELDQMTQQNAALVEQSAAASQSLNDQARMLEQAVGRFRLDGAQAVGAAVPLLQ